MMKCIIIAGTGGQGVVAAGEFLSEALFRNGYEVIFTRSYGSEARGGSCKSEILVSEREIFDLQQEKADILIVLSVPAYTKYIGRARPGSLVLVDSQVLESTGETAVDLTTISVPASSKAVELGNSIVANMVLLGALAKHSELLNLDDLKAAVSELMRASMREINLKALEAGHS